MSIWKLLRGRWGTGDDETDDVRIDASTNSIQTVDYEHHEIHAGSHYFVEGWTSLDTAGTLYVSLITPDTTKWSHFVWEIKSSGVLETSLYEVSSGGMTGGARATIHANNRNANCWTGIQDGGTHATIFTDSTQSWTIDALIGLQIFNQTDGSSAIITDNTATTVTVAALLGGTDNDFDDDDVVEINNSQMTVTAGVTVATTLGLLLSNTKVGGEGFKDDAGGSHARGDEIMLRQNTTYLRKFLSSSDANIISFKASWYEHANKHN